MAVQIRRTIGSRQDRDRAIEGPGGPMTPAGLRGGLTSRETRPGTWRTAAPMYPGEHAISLPDPARSLRCTRSGTRTSCGTYLKGGGVPGHNAPSQVHIMNWEARWKSERPKGEQDSAELGRDRGHHRPRFVGRERPGWHRAARCSHSCPSLEGGPGSDTEREPCSPPWRSPGVRGM